MHIKMFLKKHNIHTTKYVIILVVLQLLMSLTALFFAYFSKEAIDSVFDETTHTFMISAIFLAFLLIIQLITSTITPYLKALFLMKFENTLKGSMYFHILRTPYSDISLYHSGDLLNHLTSDIHHVADGKLDIIPRLVFYSVRFIGAFILLFLIDPLLSLLLVSLGFVLFLASRLLSKPIKERHKKLQEVESKVKGYIQESFVHIPVIKSFEAEPKMTDRLNQYQDEHYKALERRQRLSLLTSFGMTGFLVIGYGCAIILGALRLKDGAITYGGLTALIQLVGHLQSPFGGLSQLVPKYYQMMSSFERIKAIDDIKLENISNENITFDTLTASHLSFAYDQELILNNVNFTIKAGTAVQITGESGHGKTTLIKLLLGLYQPTSGLLNYTIHNTSYPMSSSSRSLFSYVPQGIYMMSGTIRDNLNMYKDVSDDELWRVLRLCMLDQDILSLPLKLDTPLKEKGAGLSEGQLQRLMIARALLKVAPILLLDEVTSSLDQALEQQVLSHIKKLTGKTLIVISHRKLPDSFVDAYITF